MLRLYLRRGDKRLPDDRKAVQVESYSSKIGAGLRRRARSAARRARGLLPRSARPAILMYHRIDEERFDPWGLAVTPAHFRGHLRWLSENRTVLRLEEFADLHRRSALPSDAVAITMDDGYSCNAETASRLLDEFRLPATIFLPVDLIEKGDPFWWDELEELVLDYPGASIELDGRSFALGRKSSADRRWRPAARHRTPRQAAFHAIHSSLVTKKPGELNDAMDDLRRQAGRSGKARTTKEPMSPEQVRRIGSEFIEFGSHALSHPWLPSLDSAEQAAEIAGSVDKCRSLTGSRPATFAYPFGAFNEECERLAQQAGFVCACSTEESAVAANSRIFALPRVQVSDCSASQLARRLAAL